MGELGALPPDRAIRLRSTATPRSGSATSTSSSRTGRSPELREQGARCMECGIPFCHNGCPLGNLIPDWNDLVYRDRWFDAIRQLHATNNFPEFTGRLCPAPCEAACVLEIREGDAVTIKQIENSIIDRAWEEGWVTPGAARGRDRLRRRGRRLGPGRHGLPRSSCAARAIAPCSSSATRPPAAWSASASRTSRSRSASSSAASSRCAPRASSSASASTSARTSPSTSCATSSTRSCWPPARARRATCRRPGRELDGVHFAMDYLYGRNRWVADNSYEPPISAAGKNVVVIGGGDTGADCVANSQREGARADRPARGAPRAARAPPRRQDAVAAVAAEVPPLLRDGGGRRARHGRAGLPRLDEGVPRRRGPRDEARRRPREPREPVRPAARGHRVRDRGRPRAAGDGLPAPRAAAARRARHRQGPARQREGADVRDVRGRACSPPATRAAASRSSCGRSTRAGSARGWSSATSARSSRASSSRRGNVAPADEGPEGPPRGRATYGINAGAPPAGA